MSRLAKFAVCSALVLFAAVATATAAEKKVVIPFDFTSKFDKGKMGESLGDMVWQKLGSRGGYVLPESMLDVRDTCEQNHVRLSGDTPLEDVRKVVEGTFAAQIGIWGSVELAPGAEEEVYDIVIKCVDFSAPDGPKTLYECDTRTKTAGEIPHLYIKQLIDGLCESQGGSGAAGSSALAEANWRKNPNLVGGDGFEKGARGVPTGWDPTSGQFHEPLGHMVKWIPEPGNPENHIIRFDIDKEMAGSYGVFYYSLAFPVEENATYRFQCRWRSMAPTVKVFIKCYDQLPTVWHRMGAGQSTSGSSERREVYRSQENLNGPKKVWNTHTEDFTPKHTMYSPHFARVMLYGYQPPGILDWDDIVVKKILDAPSQGAISNKVKRRSTETKVTEP